MSKKAEFTRSLPLRGPAFEEFLTAYQQAHAYMDVGGRATQEAKAE